MSDDSPTLLGASCFVKSVQKIANLDIFSELKYDYLNQGRYLLYSKCIFKNKPFRQETK